jgi:cyclohexanone monooxygenase
MDGSTETLRDCDALQRKYLEERNKRLLAEGVNQYVAVEDKFAAYAEDPYAEPGFTRDPVTEDVDALVVGGGFSGLLAANALLKQGIADIRVIEKGSDFGGTWYWNRYPGCRCDVESYSYMPLLEDYGDMPTEKYSSAVEIFAHARKLGRSLGLYEKSYLRTGVTEIGWDPEAVRWTVRTDRGDTIRARFVTLATGILSRPKLPGIPGIETFKGHSFHTSRWDYSYTGGDCTGNLSRLHDKRVAIIGTGASAAQAIPHLGAACRHLYVVQRTPAAVDARNNKPTDPAWWTSLEAGWWEKRARNFESFLIGIPQKEDLVADGWTYGWAKLSASSQIEGLSPDEQKRLRQLADFERMDEIRSRIDSIVQDPATAEALKPYFNWMCKRPLFVDGYFETFNRPNVTLLNVAGKGLDRITENAIVFEGKSYEVDCIIYASGFEVAASADRAGWLQIVGADGQTLQDYWKDGMKSLHGMFVHGFPNLAILNALKQAGITWNITFMMRKQAEHFAAVVRRCIDSGIDMFEVKPEAEAEWLETLKRKASIDENFLRNCTPGYYNNEGKEQSNSIWISAYGGGPFEYMSVLEEWRSTGFAEDFAVHPTKHPVMARD